MKKFILKQLLFLGISIVGWFIASGKIFNNIFEVGGCRGTPNGTPCLTDTFSPDTSLYFGLGILILGLILLILHPSITSIRLLSKKSVQETNY
ncbi:MAG: hypothetical protein KBC11_00175 [Candidatus Pacebacteria bacterium]|nr:hypothetical protein [Candidatus Paceibacterota bacterium]